ncbi:MAG: hypothetical protein EZS28_045807, partial [Streblomastix strix]
MGMGKSRRRALSGTAI